MLYKIIPLNLLILDFDIYIISVPSTDNQMLKGLFAGLSDRCVILLEDIGAVENPGTDLTQISLTPDRPCRSNTDAVPQTSDGEAGVECARAYEMLMRFVTIGERMDIIARALERGCKADGRGWCAVKQDVVWQVLDGMCG